MTRNNAVAAETIRRNAVDVADCRLLLEMVGLVEPDGHVLLPDEALRGTHPTSTLPPDVVHVPAKQSTVPPGLRVLPPPTAITPPSGRKAARPAPAVRHRAAVAECGTVSGYAKHLRNGEATCQPCRDASAAKWRDKHPKSTATARTPVAPRGQHLSPARCGTRSGYERHRRNNEEPCQPCREANRGRGRVGPKVKPIPHGSMAGYRAHYRRQELPVCDHCNDAYRADQRAKAARKKAQTVSELAAANSAAIAVELDTWFATAQRSPSRRVRGAAGVAVGALVQLRMALAELARQERAAELRARSTGETA